MNNISIYTTHIKSEIIKLFNDNGNLQPNRGRTSG